MRASGILMHISSLPSEQGIGTFGAAAYSFVDFLVAAGQRYWQILPIGPTSYGDSPYQSFSTFAGNPYFIDLPTLQKAGLLDVRDYENIDWGSDPGSVDYEKLYQRRFEVLKIAFQRGRDADSGKVAQFRAENADWVEDYALFMAVKYLFGGGPWSAWPDDIRRRTHDALAEYRERLRDDVDFWVYTQYLFWGQWKALKGYANEKGVSIIGDLPIYVAMDSADAWANPKLFELDDDLRPTFVSGVPPDYFAPEGQLWGNPIYRWQTHRATGYSWWVERVRSTTTMFDMVRIDHFRGFAGFYAVPAGDKNAVNGHWEKGPGMEVFDAIRQSLGSREIIAEDLGVMDDDVVTLLATSGFPGMKVLQFAFSPDWDNGYLPHNHTQKCVVYTGTHDNDTTASWWENALTDEQRRHAKSYLRLSDEEGIVWGVIRGAWASVADLAIAPIQDFLVLGGGARMNMPSTLGGNWRFRVTADMLTDELAERTERLSGLFQRSAL